MATKKKSGSEASEKMAKDVLAVLAESRSSSVGAKAEPKKRTLTHVEQVTNQFENWDANNMFILKTVKHIRSMLKACNCPMTDQAIVEQMGEGIVLMHANALKSTYQQIAEWVVLVAQNADEHDGSTTKVESPRATLIRKIGEAVVDGRKEEVKALTAELLALSD